MHFLFRDHLARVLFEEHGSVTHQFEQSLVKREAFLFGVERFQQNVVDTVRLCFQQRTDL